MVECSLPIFGELVTFVGEATLRCTCCTSDDASIVDKVYLFRCGDSGQSAIPN